jgi:hypothetical protein
MYPILFGFESKTKNLPGIKGLLSASISLKIISSKVMKI